MRHLRSAAALSFSSLALLAATGCGGGSSSSSGNDATNVAKANVSRDTSPTVAANDGTNLVAGNDDFAFAMYGQLTRANPTANLFYSPYSISLALSMAYAGAAGSTATDMAKALDFTLPTATLFPAFDALDLSLAADGKNAKGTNGQPFALNVANTLYAEETLELKAPFLQTLATSFGAGVRLTDFAKDPEGSRAAINSWVSDNTNAKIPTLLPAGSVTADTLLALVDAIYFDAAWQTPFEPIQTSNATFTTPSGAVQAPTMHETTELDYASVNGVAAVELPYSGGSTSMIVILPDSAHAAAFDAGFDSKMYTSLVSAMASTQVALSLPKFSFNGGTISLKQELTALGMGSAFGGSADFSGISTTPMQISDVYHQAFIDVDESGTEAAAATAVLTVGSVAFAGTPVAMTVDHPFAIVIREVASGAIIFAGKVNAPTSAT